MAKKRWHVVCDPSATDPKRRERIWTVSRSPKEPGWTTDAGFPGYGLTYRQAHELAAAANLVRHHGAENIWVLMKDRDAAADANVLLHAKIRRLEKRLAIKGRARRV